MKYGSSCIDPAGSTFEALRASCLLRAFAFHILTVTTLLPLASDSQEIPTLNEKADGYRGIWYMNQPSGDEYVYKYSGGLGTYCAKHRPFAVYAPAVNKTFFCFGGAPADNDRQLLHMVSEFDHATQTLPRPTILLDKQTDDAHDNPVISLDAEGYIWIFSTSHGRARPSFIHRSRQPYDVSKFERVPAIRASKQGPQAIDNFSYMQAWYREPEGFLCFFTRYGDPAARTAFFMSSKDGVNWSRWIRLAAIEQGHYQVSGIGREVAGTTLNYHPQGKGLNWRTNLYYLETRDGGETWRNAAGEALEVPLTKVENPALVHDFAASGLNVYLKDLRYDAQDRPLILFLTSPGFQSGPKNDPRTWWLAKYTTNGWRVNVITTSDNNYDMGELWLVAEDDWRVIAPTAQGPQAYNPGGEIEMWQSRDQGYSWEKMKQLTHESSRNHTYVRRPLEQHSDFFALWADGHGRRPSKSYLYFADEEGSVYRLPRKMQSDRVDAESLRQ